MAQSINSTVEFTTTGVSYLGLGGKVGKFLLGDKGIEFYNDANVEDYIQIPWTSIEKLVPTSPEIKSADILKSLPTKENFSLPQKILAKF